MEIRCRQLSLMRVIQSSHFPINNLPVRLISGKVINQRLVGSKRIGGPFSFCGLGTWQK